MAPEGGEKKTEKSYLSSAVDSINPWAGKESLAPGSTAKNSETRGGTQTAATGDPGDHSITHLYGQSSRTYPRDCPALNVQWFHAVDVPKRKPQLGKPGTKTGQASKQHAVPKKFSAFSASDSNSLESSYQRLLEAAEAGSGQEPASEGARSTQPGISGPEPDKDSGSKAAAVKVPVNEDFLFDVDIEQRELSPVYWLGPIYEVRRGTWFFQEGSSLRPCEENLAAQLEQGYLKMRPWIEPARPPSQSGPKNATAKQSHECLQVSNEIPSPPTATSSSKSRSQDRSSHDSASYLQSYRLFGTYMNSVATYQDATTAWLSSDSMLSWVTSSVYQRFAGGGYMSGVKLIRGYSEHVKGKDKEKDKEGSTVGGRIPGLDERQQKLLNRRSAPPRTTGSGEERATGQAQGDVPNPRQAALQRQLSSFLEADGQGPVGTEEQIQQEQEQEIQGYHTQAGESQGRQIDHLILVTHGIGQQLGLRMESVNFVHDVNVLRKTLKSVYSSSDDLKALNSELGSSHGNCRVQVLPVCWRHLLDFPRQRERRQEYDLGDISEDDAYPSLDDITVEGVAFARSLISDLALDVLLYQSSYREEITRIVLQECNRMLKLYKERNPEFHGKVHVMGHSLGSAILFDILCHQRDEYDFDETKNPLRFWPSHGRSEPTDSSKEKPREMKLQFDVEDFYCLGSPVGLFQMLEGRSIAARVPATRSSLGRTLTADLVDDPFLSETIGMKSDSNPSKVGPPGTVSSPKAGQLFNVFHPSDPIAYRLEPLISPAMATLKPQSLPYTKKGLFDVANQGLTGIGAKVGQSVSGLWSSLSAGIASNMLNRSLGLTNEEVARMADQAHPESKRRDWVAGGEVSSEKLIDDEAKRGEKTNERKKQLADTATLGGGSNASGNDATLIDDELETLFSQFQRSRTDSSYGKNDGVGATEDMHRVRKMRLEEEKVRALNRNGRVDYSIQESALDFNPINTVASHMCYWADVDVNHFVLSQLLSNRRPEQNNPRPARG